MSVRTALQKKAKQVKGKKGFTLVELVIVIAVLAIIAFIAIPAVTNVINNANASADASNAQAIETAIKTVQSECAANATTPSEKAKKVIEGDRNLSSLLAAYGVSNDVLKSPKVSGNGFYYNSKSGKVIAATATAEAALTDHADYAQLHDSTNANPSTFTAKDDADADVTDGTKPATITIVP